MALIRGVEAVVFSECDLTNDGFLDGKLTILQPAFGYRAGTDPVLLAAAVDAQSGDSVLELGCGVGVASLCLGWRVRGLVLVGVEIQPDYAVLAQRNATKNALPLEVHCADIRALPTELRERSFDHVFVNPPYFLPKRTTPARDGGRETANAGPTPLADWLDVAVRRLGPGGILTIIQRAERLQELLSCLNSRVGSIFIKPLAARRGRDAERIIVRARKGGKGGVRLQNPLIMHEGDRHSRDTDSYTNLARGILRDGAPLPWTVDSS